MSGHKCRARNCDCTRRKNPDLSFFRFPHDPERVAKWLVNMGREDLLKYSSEQLYKCYLCARHFERKYFMNDFRKSLTQDAVPTIFDEGKYSDHIQVKDHAEEERNLLKQESVPDLADILFKKSSKLTHCVDLKLERSYQPCGETTEDTNVHRRPKEKRHLCRLCGTLCDSKQLVCIFGKVGSAEQLHKKISRILPFEMVDYDDMPKQLCSKCIDKVHMCDKAINLFIETDKKPCNLLETECLNKRSIKESHNCKVHDCNGVLKMLEFSSIDSESTSSTTLLQPKSELTNYVNGSSHTSQSFASVQVEAGNAEESNEINNPNAHQLGTDMHPAANSTSRVVKAIEYNKQQSHESSNILKDIYENFSSDITVDSEEYHTNNTNITLLKEIIQNSDSFKCITCGQIFQNEYVLYIHKTVIHDKTVKVKIKRGFCKGDKHGQVKYIVRNRKKNSAGYYKCSICAAKFKVRSQFAYHMRRHKGQKPESYLCEVCGKLFKEQYLFINHSHSAKKQFHCIVCKELFQSRSALRQHVKTHSEQKMACNVCDKVFYSPRTLSVHQQLHSTEKQLCDRCGKVFSSLPSLKLHRKLHVKCAEKLICPVCEKSCVSRASLNMHKLSHTEGSKFLCLVCNKSFLSEHHLKVHNQIHSKIKPYKCHECNWAFRSQFSLIRHKIIHENSRRFTCRVCECSFPSIGSLLKHRAKDHTKDDILIAKQKYTSCETDSTEHNAMETSFQCNICDKVLSSQRYLANHMAVHNANKPFLCDICGHGSTSKQLHDIHVRLHTGETPYECVTCNKRFRSSAALSQHKVIHRNVYDYVCEICHKAFKRNQSLVSHKLTHSDVKQHTCPRCGKSFKQKCTLLNHLRNELLQLQKDKKIMKHKDRSGETIHSVSQIKVIDSSDMSKMNTDVTGVFPQVNSDSYTASSEYKPLSATQLYNVLLSYNGVNKVLQLKNDGSSIVASPSLPTEQLYYQECEVVDITEEVFGHSDAVKEYVLTIPTIEEKTTEQ